MRHSFEGSVTVAELIEVLKKFPANMKVGSCNYYNDAGNLGSVAVAVSEGGSSWDKNSIQEGEEFLDFCFCIDMQ